MYKLATHIKIHQGTLEFSCADCGKCFASRAALNKHMMSHKKSFQCELCQKLFSRKDNLQAHFQTHFRAQGNSGLVLEFICSFCHRSVGSKEELVAHFQEDQECGRCCQEAVGAGAREEVVEYDGEVEQRSDTEIILVEQQVEQELGEQPLLVVEEPLDYH